MLPFYPAEQPTHSSMRQPHAEYSSRFKESSCEDPSHFGTSYAEYRHGGTQDPGADVPFTYSRFENRPVPQPANLRPLKGYSAQYPITQPDILPSINAPMIPPLRIDERYIPDQPSFSYDQQTAYDHYEIESKDEKVVGGVSATLDYELEQMTCFVAETTVGMYALYASDLCISDIDLLRSIKPQSPEPQGFRKWVLQVLSATRLPSATILLSLSYMALRVRQQYAAGTLNTTERALYQMLTISLILGSKFLDDNTFQNKSWAEVSHINVTELNKDEREWLSSFGHRLHHDPRGADGFEACQELWNTYKRRVSVPAVLHPLDTNVRRQRSVNQLTTPGLAHQFNKSPNSSFHVDPRFSDSQYPTPTYSPYEQWFGHQQNIESSPPTAPHSGPQTPEYYPGQSLWAASTLDKYPPHQQYGYPVPQFAPHSATFNSGWNTPHFSANSQAFWNCHGAACQCVSCRQSQMMAPRYGPIVVG